MVVRDQIHSCRRDGTLTQSRQTLAGSVNDRWREEGAGAGVVGERERDPVEREVERESVD